MATAKTDARTRRTNAQDPERASRAAADLSRTDEDGTALTSQQRLQQIRDEFRQEALPTAPEIPGYHVCWLSSTSTYDPIQKRMRLGYTPVRADDIPGFNADRATSGAFEGCVSCNEMLLFKIPQDVYEMIMKEFHHDQPLREEESLKAALKKQGNEGKDSSGKELGEIEGFEDIAVKRSAPQFV